jgi:hypothetical protein
MKCILNAKTGGVKRVDDKVAASTVATVGSEWAYCGKEVWKKANAKPVKAEKPAKSEKKTKKASKKGSGDKV